MKFRWWGWWRRKKAKSVPLPYVSNRWSDAITVRDAEDEETATRTFFHCGAFSCPEEIEPSEEEMTAPYVEELPEAWPLKSRSVRWVRRVCCALIQEIMHHLKSCYKDYGDKPYIIGTKLMLEAEYANLEYLKQLVEENDEVLCKAVFAMVEQARRKEGVIWLAYSAFKAAGIPTKLTDELCYKAYNEALGRYSEECFFEWTSYYVPYYFFVLPEHRPKMIKRMAFTVPEQRSMATVCIDVQTGYLYSKRFPEGFAGYQYITTGEYCMLPLCNFYGPGVLFGENGEVYAGLTADNFRDYFDLNNIQTEQA